MQLVMRGKITGTQNGDKTQVILTLADDVAIGTGQNVTVGYAKSAGNRNVDTDNSTDARVEVADFFATVASSSSLDVTAPTLSSSTLDATGKVITLTFAEALKAQADSAAIEAGFTVKVDGATIDASKTTGTQNGG